MDGQNLNNEQENNQNMNAAPVVEPAPEAVTEPAPETVVETVNVYTGSSQDSTSNYSNSQDSTSNYSNYQDNTSNYSSYQSSTSGNYQDNTSQYYTTPVYTDNSNPNGENTPGTAIGSLVLGILSILFSCCCMGGGIVFAIPGIIMGLSANKKQKTGVGTAGIICSIIGIVLNAIMLLFILGPIVIGFAAEM